MCQSSSAWRKVSPFFWMAKSTMDVVPPNMADVEPVEKSSMVVAPMKGMSKWVCTSMPPGTTTLPRASSVFLAGSVMLPTATTRPSATARSPTKESDADTMVPPLTIRS